MAREEIKVIINEDGEVEVAVSGHRGKSCKDLTKALEKALGSVTSDKKTPEYHMNDPRGKVRVGR